MTWEGLPLDGQVALVAGATRGAGRGIARALGAAGALVYCTGRSAAGQAGGMDRPETINETADLIREAGGRAVAVRADHTREAEVADLAARVRAEAGRLDVLVNSIWGADPMIDWSKSFWELDLGGVRDYLDQTLVSHLTTSRHFAPLMVEADRGLIVEVIDGHFAGYRGHILYDLVKAGLARMAYGMAMELARTGVTALSLSPGFLRSEAVLGHFGVAEDNWREAIAKDPFFAESETPALVGRAAVALAADPNVKRKAGLIHFAADLAREYGFTDVDGRTPDFPAMFDAQVKAVAEAPAADDHGRFLMWARYGQIHSDPARRDLAVLLSKALGLGDLGPGLGPAA
ncbi:MAG: SDR family NAD(P)-dependent oxidoreductase [Phenylobacterium sp.]|uniref:SDR family oxidoreductase n=1 Tax=Phenylobacterium sp. TaxID=1871053 RepID=UPI00260074F5|nr:SDR family oxidoreductase [Phenylobacterium sp.]MBI1196377.1 SDR family NAD(P)-dependent oxidoreductase [Phenylobacterium sp.]